MKKFKVVYETNTDNDCCSVWTYADSKEDAIDKVKNEYWDIETIIECYEI